MAKFKVETEQSSFIITEEVEADYMEVGNNLIFKNRSANTCVAAFRNWISVVEVKE